MMASTDVPVWCVHCEMWLNGFDMKEDHDIGKKHRKHTRLAKGRVPLWSQQEVRVSSSWLEMLMKAMIKAMKAMKKAMMKAMKKTMMPMKAIKAMKKAMPMEAVTVPDDPPEVFVGARGAVWMRAWVKMRV